MESQGRNRVLCWEGTEQEQQVAMQQNTVWLTDADNCSCQALDGRSLGPLLALGKMEDGRIVLFQLVKWPHHEKLFVVLSVSSTLNFSHGQYF